MRVSEKSIGQVDRLPVGLVARVGRWALVSWLALTVRLKSLAETLFFAKT